jgi:hypothetical protein
MVHFQERGNDVGTVRAQVTRSKLTTGGRCTVCRRHLPWREAALFEQLLLLESHMDGAGDKSDNDESNRRVTDKKHLYSIMRVF